MKEFIEFLNGKNCFKLILGANNQNLSAIYELAEIYSLAGCRFFDISASYDVYNALTMGLKTKAFICMSIGADDDIHFTKCKINKNICNNCVKCKKVCNQNAISDNFIIDEKKCTGCKRCEDTCPLGAVTSYQKQNDWDFELFKKADCIEFHISTKNEEEIFSKWKLLVKNYDGVLSICLNRKNFSDTTMVKILDEMLKIKNKNIIIQADGNPMSGYNNDYSTTLQALACGELIKKNFKDIPVFLSGGVNSKTVHLAKLFNIDISGVGVGSYARKIIQTKESKEEKIKAAKELIKNCANKEVPGLEKCLSF